MSAVAFYPSALVYTMALGEELIRADEAFVLVHLHHLLAQPRSAVLFYHKTYRGQFLWQQQDKQIKTSTCGNTPHVGNTLQMSKW